MKILESPEDLATWISSAQPGSICTYFRGLLMRERAFHDPALPVPPDLLNARKMWALYVAGRVTLVQKKIGEFDYLYQAQKIA